MASIPFLTFWGKLPISCFQRSRLGSKRYRGDYLHVRRSVRYTLRECIWERRREKGGSVRMTTEPSFWTRLTARLGKRLSISSKSPGENAGNGRLLYAIGDIHGCLDELRALHDLIAVDAAERMQGGVRPVTLVYVGDYIDRGPDSRGVIDALLQPPPITGADRIFLKGNHEEAMLNFLQSPEEAAGWLDFGGFETLASYGVQQRGGGAVWRMRLAEAMALQLPPDHKLFFDGLLSSWSYGEYGFVHAGVRPGRPWEAQMPEDLLWIREPFLSSRARFEKRIVHGHTICTEPEVRAHRIGIDTGAYYSGILTAIVLDGGLEEFIQASRV